jgi:hypothetical protein
MLGKIEIVILVFINYGLGLLLVLQILPLCNQTPKRKTLVELGRVKFCDPLYVEWIDHKT